ncbi:hypothetical protein QNH20_09900 [Neobacillus sp. WH10]|nr:hypothetical protein [Neobacillus sp. WH10]WHY79423.1 hypothetical protein QNH20_09900 [Neobacillus sp. WH10]
MMTVKKQSIQIKNKLKMKKQIVVNEKLILIIIKEVNDENVLEYTN